MLAREGVDRVHVCAHAPELRNDDRARALGDDLRELRGVHQVRVGLDIAVDRLAVVVERAEGGEGDHRVNDHLIAELRA